jgi:hypothetical protein
MQRPGSSRFATSVRTLTTGSHAMGRDPADDPLLDPVIDAGARRNASAASPAGTRIITDVSGNPDSVNDSVNPPAGDTAVFRSPFAERSTLVTMGSPPARAGVITRASPRWTGPGASFAADTSR